MLAQFETLNALLQTRYSCRAFLDRKGRKPRCWLLL